MELTNTVSKPDRDVQRGVSYSQPNRTCCVTLCCGVCCVRIDVRLPGDMIGRRRSKQTPAKLNHSVKVKWNS